MRDKEKELINIGWVYDFWLDSRDKLDKKDIELNVVDFDYTLFSRDEELEKEEELKNNRWDKWPEFIFKNIWMSNFLDKYYKNKNIPKSIISKMTTKYDIILTAWQYEFQIAKINLCSPLNDFKVIVTKDWKSKIISLIRYVLFELKFVPNKIRIYEDRPEYFVEYREFLENTLWTEIEIMKVEMNWNKNEPKITKL
jgi:hypothetical protein